MATRCNENNLNKCMTQVLTLTTPNITVSTLFCTWEVPGLVSHPLTHYSLKVVAVFLSTSKEVSQVTATLLDVLHSLHICCFASYLFPHFLGFKIKS